MQYIQLFWVSYKQSLLFGLFPWLGYVQTAFLYPTLSPWLVHLVMTVWRILKRRASYLNIDAPFVTIVAQCRTTYFRDDCALQWNILFVLLFGSFINQSIINSFNFTPRFAFRSSERCDPKFRISLFSTSADKKIGALREYNRSLTLPLLSIYFKNFTRRLIIRIRHVKLFVKKIDDFLSIAELSLAVNYRTWTNSWGLWADRKKKRDM